MTCKFCLQNKPTIDAHIIPKCFFKPLLGGRPPIAVSLSPESFPKRIPIGIYDKELVCIDCEGLWNDYDDYVCKFIIQDFNKNFKKSESGEWFEAQQYDYKKLKLFFLSLLWRASASNADFYKEVNVGPKFDSKLKKMIKNKDPGSPSEFSVIIFRLQKFLGKHSIIGDPQTGKPFARTRFYKFYLGSFIVWLKVDSQKTPRGIENLIIKPGRPCCVPISSVDDDILIDKAREIVSKKQNIKIKQRLKKNLS